MPPKSKGAPHSQLDRFMRWKPAAIPHEGRFDRDLWASWNLPSDHPDFGAGLTPAQAAVLASFKETRVPAGAEQMVPAMFDALPTPVLAYDNGFVYNRAFSALLTRDEERQLDFLPAKRVSLTQTIRTLVEKSRSLRDRALYLPIAGSVFRVRAVGIAGRGIIVAYFDELAVLPMKMAPHACLTVCLRASGWGNKEISFMTGFSLHKVHYLSKAHREAYLQLRRALFQGAE